VVMHRVCNKETGKYSILTGLTCDLVVMFYRIVDFVAVIL
jgi:hypothetical protein